MIVVRWDINTILLILLSKKDINEKLENQAEGNIKLFHEEGIAFFVS
jgi:hypothetical protein